MRIINKQGFTLVEVVAAVAIIGIFLGITLWNIPSLQEGSRVQSAIHKAILLSTAKEAFLRERGVYGLKEYNAKTTNSDRFELVKQYLPYMGQKTSLKDYTPKGFHIEMSLPGMKVGLFKESSRELINY